MRRLRPPLVVLAVALLCAALAGGQPPADPPADPEAPFGEFVNVDVVEVDVQVTDRQGRPVPGLSREDFQVFEDGRPMNITNFRVVTRSPGGERGAPPVETLPVPEAVEKSEAPAVELPAVSVPEEVGEAPRHPPHVVFYIDNANIRPLHRTRVMNELRRFVVESQVAGARMMVVSNDRRLRVRQAFTTDSRAVLAGLAELEEDPVFGETAHDDFRDLVREIEDRNARQNWLESRVRGYAEQTQLELKQSLRALRSLIDTLAGLEGRKALVYVSDGLPLTPAEELYHALERRFDNLTVLHQAMRFNSSRDFEELAHAANTAGVTFYTLHAAGLEAPMASDAEVAGSGVDELRSTVDSVRLANTQGSGRLLAAETGGLAFLNQNSFLDGLEQMVEDLSFYYSLGYQPLRSGDGRYHEIEVRLRDRDKSLKVRHRQGYRDRSLSHRMRDLVEATVHHGYGENPLAVDVALGEEAAGAVAGSDGPRGTRVVAVKVLIPLDKVILVPRGPEHRGQVRIYVGVQDRDGGISPIQEIEVPMAIPDAAIERARTSSWTQEIQLRMRPGPQLLVVGVWDEIGQESSVVTRRVEIPG